MGAEGDVQDGALVSGDQRVVRVYTSGLKKGMRSLRGNDNILDHMFKKQSVRTFIVKIQFLILIFDNAYQL